MRNTYLTIGIIVVLLVVVAFAIVRSKLPQITPFAQPTPTPILEALADNIFVSQHTPATSAVVDSVTLTKPGFVAIHDKQDGKAGAILGVSDLLSAGTHENVVIALSRKTAQGEKLFAMIHADNGDGKFDPAKPDEPAKDQTGNIIEAAIDVSNNTGGSIPATGLGEDDK